MTPMIREGLGCYVAAVVVLVIAGPVLHWPPFAQMVAALIALSAIGILQMPPPRTLSKAFARTRSGWSAALNGLTIFAA